jgi:hypothetical protein
MLIFNVNKLHVYREGTGLRVTIPTAHSSSVLTRKEAHELTKVLVQLFSVKGGKK